MTWRFRKSFCPLPGVRITLSPSGLSTSVGVGPFRATIGPRGPAVTANIPGTGISYRHAFGSLPQQRLPDQPTPSFPQLGYDTPAPNEPKMSDIKSSGSEELTTPGLSEFKRLLEEARREHGTIVQELTHARSEESSAVGRYTSWCIDPAEPAQLIPLKRRPQREFSCPAPDAGAVDYRN